MDFPQHSTYTDGSGNKEYRDGTPSEPPTRLVAKWFNVISNELCYLVEQAGITLDYNDTTQVYDAVQALITIGAGAVTGNIVKISEQSLGTDDTATFADGEQEAFTLEYTPIDQTNKRWIDIFLDLEISSNDAEYQGEIRLKYEGSTLKAFPIELNFESGEVLVKSTTDTLVSDSASSATSFVDSGLEVNYVPINAANKRVIRCFLDWEMSTNSNSIMTAEARLRYSNDGGSSWSTLGNKKLYNDTTGGTDHDVQAMYYFEHVHEVSDSSPDYKIEHPNWVGGGRTSTINMENSKLIVDEYAQVGAITKYRVPLHLRFLHDDDATAAPTYVLAHIASVSGDQSVIKSGTKMVVSEVKI